METYKFKTSLKCTGCVNAIKPGMESIPAIKEWKVDLASENRELEVTADENVADAVMDSVKKAGYEIARL